MCCGVRSIRSTSRKITVPAGNPSADVRAIASSASLRPCGPLTRCAEQLWPGSTRGCSVTFTGTLRVTYVATRLPLRVT